MAIFVKDGERSYWYRTVEKEIVRIVEEHGHKTHLEYHDGRLHIKEYVKYAEYQRKTKGKKHECRFRIFERYYGEEAKGIDDWYGDQWHKITEADYQKSTEEGKASNEAWEEILSDWAKDVIAQRA